MTRDDCTRILIAIGKGKLQLTERSSYLDEGWDFRALHCKYTCPKGGVYKITWRIRLGQVVRADFFETPKGDSWIHPPSKNDLYNPLEQIDFKYLNTILTPLMIDDVGNLIRIVRKYVVEVNGDFKERVFDSQDDAKKYAEQVREKLKQEFKQKAREVIKEKTKRTIKMNRTQKSKLR